MLARAPGLGRYYEYDNVDSDTHLQGPRWRRLAQRAPHGQGALPGRVRCPARGFECGQGLAQGVLRQARQGEPWGPIHGIFHAVNQLHGQMHRQALFAHRRGGRRGAGLGDSLRLRDDGVEVVPASTWLVGVEKALAGESGAETLLRGHLEALPADRWAYVLVDCPPTLGLLTVNALAAVQAVLVPVEAHVMALQGLAQLLQTVDVVKARLNPALALAGILACRVHARTRHAQEVVEELRRRFGDLVYHVVIRDNVRLAECPSFGCPITHYAPRSPGAEDYRALATEILQRQGDAAHA